MPETQISRESAGICNTRVGVVESEGHYKGIFTSETDDVIG